MRAKIEKNTLRDRALFGIRAEIEYIGKRKTPFLVGRC